MYSNRKGGGESVVQLWWLKKFKFTRVIYTSIEGNGFKHIDNSTSHSLVNWTSGILSIRAVLYMVLPRFSSITVYITVSRPRDHSI